MHRFLPKRTPDRSLHAVANVPPVARRAGFQCALVAAALVASAAGCITWAAAGPDELAGADGGLTVMASLAGRPCALNDEGSIHVTR
jgi:hypothetical protein